MTPEQTQRIHHLASVAEDEVLLPEMVVEDAADEDSPLHSLFEWDDQVAAHTYRVEQARAIIRRVRTVVVTTKHDYQAINYIKDPRREQDEAGYVAVAHIRDDEQASERALEAEISRIHSAIRRASVIARQLGRTEELAIRLAEMLGDEHTRAVA